MDLISVIIPVYNVAPYLRQCVESVRRQSYTQLEILLVDDGSTDGSGELCDTFQREDTRIRVIHQPNSGLGAARNAGIRQARGTYLLFVDSDDWIYSSMAETLYQAMIEHQADVVLCDADVVEENGCFIERMSSNLPSDQCIALSDLPRLLFVPHVTWNKLYRRELFFKEELCYPPRAWYEDFRVTTKLYAQAKRIVYLTKPLYCYRVRKGSIQQSDNLDRRREKIEAMDDILSFYKKKGLLDQYRAELEYLAFGNVYFYPSVDLIRQNRKHKLISEFSRYMNTTFPDFMRNPYLKSLSRNEKIILWLLRHGYNNLIALVFAIKSLLNK